MKRRGFSLMEMMIVLLIVAIIAAASAPMVSKKMMRDAEGGSPWMYAGLGGSITYNPDGNQNKTAMVGASTVPSAANNAKLYIETSGTEPQIAISKSGGDILKINAGSNSLYITDQSSANMVANSVSIGYGTKVGSSNSIAIGSKANAVSTYSTAIGYNANAITLSSTALGANTKAGINSTAVGYNAYASSGSVAIGNSTNTLGYYSISLGHGASASGDNTISIGSSTPKASGSSSVAIGMASNSGGASTVALGPKASASSGADAIALGHQATAGGTGAVALGHNSTAGTGSGYIQPVAIGAHAKISGYQGVALGAHSNVTAHCGIGLGAFTKVTGSSGTAVGHNASASGANAIAIGRQAKSSASNAAAIGTSANSAYANSIAIGRNARATTTNQIVLGTSSDTVYIPGRLVVGYDVLLNAVKGDTALRRGNGGELCVVRSEDLKGGDDNLRRYPTDIDNRSFFDSYISDRRLKNVGEAFSGGLDKIKQLKVYNYTFKDDEKKTPHVGVIAQDLQKVFPDAVTKGKDGFLRIRWEDIFYALVNAVKELDTKFTALNDRIKQLEAQNKQLEKQNKQLEERLSKLEKKFYN